VEGQTPLTKETNPLHLKLHHQELTAKDHGQEVEEPRGITSLPSDATNMNVRLSTSPVSLSTSKASFHRLKTIQVSSTVD